MKSKRPKVLYEETYHKPGLKILGHCLPQVPSAAPGFFVDEAYILKAGAVEIDGVRREFQDLRVYFSERIGG